VKNSGFLKDIASENRGEFWFTPLTKLPPYFSVGASCTHQI